MGRHFWGICAGGLYAIKDGVDTIYVNRFLPILGTVQKNNLFLHLKL